MRTPLQWSLLVTLLVGISNLQAQQNYWEFINETQVPLQIDESLNITVDAFQLTRLNGDNIQQLLKGIPHESVGIDNGGTISIPLPDGTFEDFKIVEAPIIAPDVEAQHPTHKDYRGHSVSNPSTSIRLGWTIRGFHAMILGTDYRAFIDPYRRNDTEHYIAYYRSDYVATATNQAKYSSINCRVIDPLADNGGIIIKDDEFTPNGTSGLPDLDLAKNTGATKRTYRLAASASQGYTNFWGSQAAALAGLQTTIARVTGIYEKEFAVCFVLVSDTRTIYTDGTLADNGSSTMGNGSVLGDNAAVLNATYGSGAYDIGHVFTTGSGGFAGLGVVCGGSKAAGTTGLPTPTGDPFDVDYVAHEIGHQCGGNHTFNATTGACGGNGNNATAYEPGSASTIMGYAGICGAANNVQTNSDDYFHVISHDEIAGHLITGSGNTCATRTTSGNTPPTVMANPSGSSYTIPANTPFQLTGSATDPNGPGTLTYCWEEFDLGPGGAISTTNAPFFRSFAPTASPTRTFPELAEILNGSNEGAFEKLPTIATILNFRLSVRDNQEGMFGGAGGFCDDQITINVTDASSNFMVTVLNTGMTLMGNDALTITWDENGTSSSPINCTNVDVQFSFDGGMTWTTEAVGQPNTGTWTGTVPNMATSTFRVRVICSDNIFFDINDANITITFVVPVELTSFEANVVEESVVLDWETATELDNDYFQIERSLDGEKFIPLGKVRGAGTTPLAQRYDFVDLTPNAGVNYYRLKQVDFDGGFEFSKTISVQMKSDKVSTKIYPSPATDVLYISAGTTINTVEIFDLTARKVLSYTSDASILTQLEVSQLLSGTYFVHVQFADGNTDMLRFVKQ